MSKESASAILSKMSQANLECLTQFIFEVVIFVMSLFIKMIIFENNVQLSFLVD